MIKFFTYAVLLLAFAFGGLCLLSAGYAGFTKNCSDKGGRIVHERHLRCVLP